MISFFRELQKKVLPMCPYSCPNPMTDARSTHDFSPKGKKSDIPYLESPDHLLDQWSDKFPLKHIF